MAVEDQSLYVYFTAVTGTGAVFYKYSSTIINLHFLHRGVYLILSSEGHVCSFNLSVCTRANVQRQSK